MKLILAVSLPIFFILLSGALGEEYVDYRIVPTPIQSRRFARAANPMCSRPGTICNDCKNIHFCDNQNSSTLVWTCGATETCNKGACTTVPSPSCSSIAKLDFVCTTEGFFPDPADCVTYHMCVGAADNQLTITGNIARTCANGWSYNARTSYCDKRLTTTSCATFPVPLCTRPAQTGALVENPSMYYICMIYEPITTTTAPPSPSPSPLTTTLTPPNRPVLQNLATYTSTSQLILYPRQYICPNGKRYDGNYQCK